MDVVSLLLATFLFAVSIALVYGFEHLRKPS
jgi:hypothetical protein